MHNFLKIALTNRVGVALVVMALAVTGLFMVTQLPIKLYPNTTKTRIYVRVSHPSYTAEDFADQYASKVNQALSAIEGIDEIEASFNNGNSNFRVYFEWGFDGKEARSLVEGAMAAIRSSLPEESEDYFVGYWAGRTVGFFSAALYSEKMTAQEVYDLVEPKIRPRLEKVKGVDFARLTSTEEVRVDIFIDPTRSLAFGYTADDIASAVRSGYRDISIGSFRDGRDVVSVRIRRHIDQLEDIENIVLGTKEGRETLLKDVATINVYQGLPRDLYSVDGRQAITLFAMPDVDGNVRDMSEDIKFLVQDVLKDLPDDIQFKVLVDPAEYINNAISNVVMAALMGGSLAILVVLVFLGEARNTIIIAISIPTSVVLSFILMNVFDVTINLISLGGLTLAVGMIVDASIVVIENIHRHRAESPDESFLDVILKSVGEVRGAIIASTLTSVVVFLPLSFTAELTSAILGDLAKTVIFALLCSLCVALILVPVLSYTIYRKADRVSIHTKHHPLRYFSSQVMPRLVERYRKVLGSLLRSKSLSVSVVGVAFVVLALLLIFVAPQIERLIIDKPDSNRITLRFDNTESKDQEEIFAAIKPIEERLLTEYADVTENLFVRIRGANSGAFTMSLTSVDERERVIRELKEKFPSNRTWRYDISRWDPAELPLPRSRDLKIFVTGPERSGILDLMEKAVDLIRKEGLYAEVSTDPTLATSTEVVLNPRRGVLHDTGIDVGKLTSVGRILLSGTRVIETTHKQEELDISIGYQEGMLRSALDFQDFLVSVDGQAVPMKHFFDFSNQRGLLEIQSLDGTEIFAIEADMAEDEAPATRVVYEDKVRALLADQLEVPAGYSLNFEDTQKEINDAISSLLVALAASVILIFVILGSQFNSVSVPSIIVMAVPLGLIGVVMSLYGFGSNVSLNSMLGTILLGGIVVNNSILIVDFFKQFRSQFKDRVDALTYCCGLRLTPILITTLTTILGMLPIALALGDGTNVIQPLGIAVSGGLGVSTLLTLFVIPCVMNLLPERFI